MATDKLNRHLLIYIAGPFRAPTAWGVEQNVRKAEEIALQLWRLGAAVICPHTNTRFFDNAAPAEIFLEGDLEILRRCDAIVLINGWDNSAGATAEAAFAVNEAIPVYHWDSYKSRERLLTAIDKGPTWVNPKYTWTNPK